MTLSTGEVEKLRPNAFIDAISDVVWTKPTWNVPNYLSKKCPVTEIDTTRNNFSPFPYLLEPLPQRFAQLTT